MGLGKTYFSVKVSETDQNRAYWASRAGLIPSTVGEVRTADILLVPWEGRSGVELSFPNGTTEFFALLSSAFDGQKIALAINRDDYKELALHGNEVRWPSIFVTAVLLPALSTILAEEIERLGHGPSPATSIELAITVENQKGQCIPIDYKGQPDRLIQTLIQETERCFSGPNSGNSAERNSPPKEQNKGKVSSHR